VSKTWLHRIAISTASPHSQYSPTLLHLSLDTHILLPSGITVYGVDKWIIKLADVA
jgi:hypothetical protein